MPATVHPISPSWPKGTAGNRTQQQARYQRVLARLAEHRSQGRTTIAVNVSDLEALLCLAASTDKALAS
jgi:hypothetical protein